MMGAMTRDQVKEILNRVLTWPPESQADVAHVVELMQEQDRSDLRLSDEQAAEVRRRLANPSPNTIPAEQVFKRFNLNHQLVAQFWYAAYQGKTALNIDNNARIRAGLYGAMDDAATRAWLRRL